MFTEAHIRISLDGTFTRFGHSGEVRTKRVPNDFIPSHHNVHFNNAFAALKDDAPEAPRKKFREPLGDKERKSIIDMYEGGKAIRSIARMVGRNPGTVHAWLSKYRQGRL